MVWETALPAMLSLFATGWGVISLGWPLLTAPEGERRPRVPVPFCVLLCMGGLAVCVAARIPLPFHYLLIYVVVTFWYGLAFRAPLARVLFAANICTTHLAIAHLFCLGVVALVLDGAIYQVWTSPPLYLLSLNAALLLLLVLIPALRRVTDAKNPAGLADVMRLKSMDRFAWYATAYTFFDTIPCLFDLPYSLISWFLIGSCLLLMVQWYIFMVYAYRISVRQHWEHEFRVLERKRAVQVRKSLELRHIALIDGVTGTYTRAYVMNLLRQWMKDGKHFSLAYIDLDGLKAINDLHGHDAGDLYLAAAGEALNNRLQARDVLARIGGDEFLVLLPDTSEAEAKIRIRAAGHTLEAQAGEYPHSFSYGVVEVPAGRHVPEGLAPDRSEASLTDAMDKLLRQADARMYETKNQRRLTRESAS